MRSPLAAAVLGLVRPGAIGLVLAACSSASSDLSSPAPFDAPIYLPPRVEDDAGSSSAVASSSSSGASSSSGGASSSSGGASSSSGGASSSSGQTAPPPPLVDPCPTWSGPPSVTVDGVAMSIDSQDLWTPDGVRSNYLLFLRVWGPGVAAGSDMVIGAAFKGMGCSDVNSFVFRPGGAPQAFPKESAARCGLSICQLPTAVGGRLRGVYEGAVEEINVASPKARRVKVVFDFVRTN